MTIQILNLLTHKSNKITFEDYLKSINAVIRDATNPYEAARFYLQGKTCVIYYKQKRGIFSYSDEFARAIHEDWLRGGNIRRSGGVNKKNDDARQKVNKLLGNLMKDREFVRYINQEFDGRFNLQILGADDLKMAYRCILLYRRTYLREVI